MNQKPSAINIIWLSMILIATVTAAYTGKMAEVTAASFASAKSAVTLALGLIGPMALWLGIMKVVEAGGLMKMIAHAIRPLMIKLFPDVPAEHPAMSAMIMNMAANALGLGNAATPMGIKAMKELDSLSKEKGVASDAMCLFLAINTSSVTLLPLGVITIRAGAGATNPAEILIPTLFATMVSTTVAIIAAKLLSKGSKAPELITEIEFKEEEEKQNNEENKDLHKPSLVSKIIIGGLILAFVGAFISRIAAGAMPELFSVDFFSSISRWLIPVLISGLLLFGFFRGVKIYEKVTEGAKEGFETAVKIIPFMVAIFVGIGMLRASGAVDIMTMILSPFTSLIGMPAEALPMALLRPLSGSGAFGMMSEIVTNEPNGFLSNLVSTMQGSTETTFYVLAVYFGSIGIRVTRHALPAALLADAAGIGAALIICRLMF